MNDVNVSEIETQLLTAHREKRWDKIRRIADLGQKGEEMEREKVELEKKQQAIKEEEYIILNGQQPPKPFKGRKARLPVTQGAIIHKYLLVTRALNDKVLSRKETLKLHIPLTNRTIDTEVYYRNKILTERKWIGEFYSTAGVQAGDFVLLEETAPGEWNLTKCDEPA